MPMPETQNKIISSPVSSIDSANGVSSGSESSSTNSNNGLRMEDALGQRFKNNDEIPVFTPMKMQQNCGVQHSCGHSHAHQHTHQHQTSQFMVGQNAAQNLGQTNQVTAQNGVQNLPGVAGVQTTAGVQAAATTTNNSLYKTELCRSWSETGSCRYGNKCQFAHGGDELRSLNRHPKYKTEYCRSYHTMGFCPYGQRCHFLHSEQERKKFIDQQRQAALNGSTVNFNTNLDHTIQPAVGMQKVQLVQAARESMQGQIHGHTQGQMQGHTQGQMPGHTQCHTQGHTQGQMQTQMHGNSTLHHHINQSKSNPNSLSQNQHLTRHLDEPKPHTITTTVTSHTSNASSNANVWSAGPHLAQKLRSCKGNIVKDLDGLTLKDREDHSDHVARTVDALSDLAAQSQAEHAAQTAQALQSNTQNSNNQALDNNNAGLTSSLFDDLTTPTSNSSPSLFSSSDTKTPWSTNTTSKYDETSHDHHADNTNLFESSTITNTTWSNPVGLEQPTLKPSQNQGSIQAQSMNSYRSVPNNMDREVRFELGWPPSENAGSDKENINCNSTPVVRKDNISRLREGFFFGNH